MLNGTDLILALLWILASVIVVGILASLAGIVAGLVNHFLGVPKDICLLIVAPATIYFGGCAIIKIVELVRRR